MKAILTFAVSLAIVFGGSQVAIDQSPIIAYGLGLIAGGICIMMGFIQMENQ